MKPLFRVQQRLRSALSSLFGRLLLVIVTAVFSSFLIATLVWMQYIQSGKEADAIASVQDLAISMASTVTYFESLPREFQHIIIDQQRNLGGSRFFLSVNTDYVDYESIRDNPLKQRLIDTYRATFRERLGQRVGDIEVDFAYPNTLRVFNTGVLFSDLPSRWVQNNLIMNPPAPVLVAQMQMQNGDWLYLASLMLPDPYVAEGISLFTMDLVIFTLILGAILMVCSWFIVRWLTRPMRTLSNAAMALGRDIHQNPIPETGTFEVRQTARAFNVMQRRILTFINDRDLLFSAISHDLKTPITRLRLRAELLEDTEVRERLNRDLNELEHLVQGALELARGTDIHEPVTRLRLRPMLEAIQEEVAVLGRTVELQMPQDITYAGKAVALKRCLSNLIHNAVFYGSEAWVSVNNSAEAVHITIVDNGPGVPESELEHIFDPFVRLESSRSRHTGGTGLGMTIARNIVHSHGGDIRLRNAMGRGLEVQIILPHE
ncbi:HAMP domain-containing protein [Natronospirillum operosum]|uniref:histidine kinase n=1 Tax=Natronospirillum operosum TaxID=2759953 RepID=A0A4Z0W925_9GAMM|nr:ATP-binding protein [Natronospirillum operosum]TGG91657.1 HAMP domain-containing protein [Natronospirillum operosum]